MSRVKNSSTSVAEMVKSAILNLSENNGSSIHAIKKYIAAVYPVDMDIYSPFIKEYVISAASAGTLIQMTGKGASGSFKLALVNIDAARTKAKAPKVKASASEGMKGMNAIMPSAGRSLMAPDFYEPGNSWESSSSSWLSSSSNYPTFEPTLPPFPTMVAKKAYKPLVNERQECREVKPAKAPKAPRTKMDVQMVERKTIQTSIVKEIKVPKAAKATEKKLKSLAEKKVPKGKGEPTGSPAKASKKAKEPKTKSISLKIHY